MVAQITYDTGQCNGIMSERAEQPQQGNESGEVDHSEGWFKTCSDYTVGSTHNGDQCIPQFSISETHSGCQCEVQ
jgi:hypothetical protein